MNKKFILISVFSIILLFGLVTSASASGDFSVDGLNFTTNLTQAFVDAELENKTLMIIFVQDSCVYCDELKENTLTDAQVQETINNNFIPVTMDVNEEYEIASQYEVYGTPTIIFFSKNATELDKIDGYVSPDEFLDVAGNLTS